MTLTENVDYTLSWHDNERQGNAYVTVSGMGNFTGVRNKYFYIDLTPITEAEIGDIPDYEYAPGKEFKPEPTVTLNGVTLKKDVDYTLSYSNNTMASSRTNRPRVNITGIGIYRSGFSKYFTINPLKLSSETIQLPNTNYGNESVTTYLRNNLIITYNVTKLTSDDFTITSVRCSASNEILDFSLSYKQNYSGTRQMTSVKLCNFSNIPEQIFKGAAVTPKPTATPKPTSAPALKLTAPVIKTSTSWNVCTLRWNPVKNAQNYIGKYIKLKTLNANTTSYRDTKISIGNKYSYMIRASRKITSGYIYSPYGKTAIISPSLSRPSITLKTLSGKQTISWKKVPGATGYVIYQKKGNGSFQKVKTVSVRNTSYTFKTSKNVTYSYKLVPYRTVNRQIKAGPASAVKTVRAK